MSVHVLGQLGECPARVGLAGSVSVLVLGQLECVGARFGSVGSVPVRVLGQLVEEQCMFWVDGQSLPGVSARPGWRVHKPAAGPSSRGLHLSTFPAHLEHGLCDTLRRFRDPVTPTAWVEEWKALEGSGRP